MAGTIGKLRDKIFRKENRCTNSEALNADDRNTCTPETEKETTRKLLVVGRESSFSDEAIDYAIEMAERLSYEIVALNTAPLSCETFRLFSSSRSKMCQDFQEISEKNVAAFAQKAADSRISFEHVVKFSGSDQAIEEVQKEKGSIEFVISDAEEDWVETRPEQGERLRRDICVYSMQL